jgi:acetyl-CoA acyltransferase
MQVGLVTHRSDHDAVASPAVRPGSDVKLIHSVALKAARPTVDKEQAMRDAVIVEAARTPLGRRGGGLAGIHPADLSAHVLTALEGRGVSPDLVDDVMWGCVTQVGEQATNIARTAVLAAGWPERIPGMTIDRQCGSSQQAIHSAAAAVISGQADLVIAGGVESMTRVPMGSNTPDLAAPWSPGVKARYPGVVFHQGVAAEAMAERWGLSRAQLDEYSAASHAKAAAFQETEAYQRFLVSVPRAEGGEVARDEGIRPQVSREAMSQLQSPFREGGVVTAASSSQISDGAAAVAVTTTQVAERHGLRPLARLHASVTVGDDPVAMLTAPIPATAKVLERARLSLGEVGAYEVNEAFATVPLAWCAETQADPARLNVWGGAIALGHPLGASGARLVTTLLSILAERSLQYGLQVICEGGGMASAMVIESLWKTR